MGGWKGEEGYRVEVKGEDRVAAVLPLQDHWLPLSNLDLLLPPLDVGIFFCYKKPDNNNDFNFPEISLGSSIVGSFKASLAKTLVTYYAFAGEVVTNSSGEPELLCSNRGVDFITAFADVELKELDLHNPDQSVEKKLIPKKKEGVLCIQLTELKCGGMVLACTFDHRIADAYSANMFLVAWAEAAAANMNINNNNNNNNNNNGDQSRSKKQAAVPSFRRSLLSPRRVGGHDTSALDKLYVPVSTMMQQRHEHEDEETSVVLNRIYYVSAADINKMQSEATTDHEQRRSKLEAFSAYLWRAVGKAAVANSNKLGKKVTCRMGVVVNGRYRLKPDLMRNYFGNVLSIPYGSIGGEDLEGMCLSDVADKVHDFLQDAATEEHFLSLIDWVEARRPEPAIARIYCTGAAAAANDDDQSKDDQEEEDGVAFVVSSGRGFPVGELDFGYGLPVFGSYHFPWGGSAGYVMPMPSATANGDWVVYMHLRQDLLEAIESDQNIFHPLTPHYFLHQN